MNSNKDIVGQIGEVASHALTPKVQQTLTATIHELRNYASMADDRDSLIGGEEKILARFRRLFEKQFSALVEFGTDYEVEAQSIRCSLAGKIDMIDKYVFVNARGAKVIEKSRMSLARELKDGTVKIISEAPLIDRAIETVIGKLRNSGEPNA